MLHLTLLASNIKRLLVVEIVIFMLLTLFVSKSLPCRLVFLALTLWCILLLVSKPLRKQMLDIACSMRAEEA